MKLYRKNFLATRLLKWFSTHGRRTLPWQNKSPYHTWISEVMLQQTQVGTVIPYYERFIKHYPSIKKLAKASEDDLLHLWTGLGYYTRARNIHRTAMILAQEQGGNFPKTLEALQQLPGIGRSTAGAILAMGFHQPAPILDGNVKRVLTRLHAIEGWPESSAVLKQLWQTATHYTPTNQVANYTQAIMDLGAMVCTKTKPKCVECPLNSHCVAYQQGDPTLYPHRKTKKPLPTKHWYFLILCNEQGDILLEKRSSHGIWGGLWCFPICERDDDPKHYCETRYACKIQTTQAHPNFKHTFSHFHLIITPLQFFIQSTLQCMEPNQRVWYNITRPQPIGLAKPVVQLITQITSRN